MKSFKNFFPIVIILLLSASVIFAQSEPAPAAEEFPSWIENPIGSIVGLVLLIAMFAGMAKVALAKE